MKHRIALFQWIKWIIILAFCFSLFLPSPAIAKPRDQEPRTKQQIPKTFAVSGFPVIGAKAEEFSWLGVGLGDDLSTRLSRCEGSLFQVERLQFNEVLRAAKLNMLAEGVSKAEQPDEEETRRLLAIADKAGQAEGDYRGADYVLVGSLWVQGEYGNADCRLHANVRMVSVATSEIISGVTADGEGSHRGYAELQERLAEQLAERMGVPEDQRVRVRNYQTEGGEVYRLFAKARELLYQGKYEEARKLCGKAEAAASHHLRYQIWATDTQAHEKMVQAAKEEEAGRLNRKRRELMRKRLREAKELKELAALANFEMAEQLRIEAETAEKYGHTEEVKLLCQEAITFYDKYLRNTGSQLVLWSFETKDRIDSPVLSDGIVYANSNDHLWAFESRTGKLSLGFRIGTNGRLQTNNSVRQHCLLGFRL